MKKKKRLAKVKESAKKPLNKLRRKQPDPVENAKVPYITNDTIAEHREEVLAGARKYIYPLQHSKHRIIILSSLIFVITAVVFFTYSLLGLYRFENTSTFMYRITQILPFPVARAEGQFVTYESYLFELRHYMHYYETQQKLNFEDEEGKAQFEEFKKQAMDQVINDAYVKKIAKEKGITVSSQEVDNEIAVVKEQSRLGTSDQVFEDVLRDFWGWSVNDFKRSLRSQLLARKVASALDTEAKAKANLALDEIKAGADFAEVAKKYSEDEGTREAGGDFGVLIDESSRDMTPKVTAAIFSQEAGQVSEVIDTGYSLEIIKTLGFEGDKARAAHIQINFKDISEYIRPARDSRPPSQYLKV
jgi:parvulin-like peptidyl-prolyl isomerase